MRSHKGRDRPGLVFSPAGLAEMASEGEWQSAPHLDLLNEQLLRLAFREVKLSLTLFPPRHGKTELGTIWFAFWYLGLFPDHRVIIGCYSDAYAEELGSRVRDLMERLGGSLFGLSIRRDSRSKTDWKIAGHSGGLRAVGRDGRTTGLGAELFIIDDPIKNWAEAISPATRNEVWKWFTAAAFTRRQPNAVYSLLFTPWNPDDLGGRLLTTIPEEVSVLRLPGLAEYPTSPESRAEKVGYDALIGLPDPLGREPDEPLWPEKFGVEHFRLAERLDPETFEPLQMLRPRGQSGGLFKQEYFEGQIEPPPAGPADAYVRYWDFAATLTGDWTVGLLMGRYGDRYWVLHVERFRAEPNQRDARIMQVTVNDNEAYLGIDTWGEREGGSAGITAGKAFCKMLSPYSAWDEHPTGAKRTRAMPFAAACGRKDVFLAPGTWNRAYLDELCAFTGDGTGYDDQVDTSSGAFSKLALPLTVDNYVATPRQGF